jgi:hypothetical protein
VGFVFLQGGELAPLDQLDHPTRVEVDAKTDPAAMLAQVLDRQPQPARPRRSEHQPVGAARKILFGERLAEYLIVGAKVFDLKTALGHAGRPAGFEGEERLALQPLWEPAPHRPTAQPFVLKRRKLPEIFEAGDFAPRIPAELVREVQPEWASRFGIEMPLHDLSHMGV